MSGTYKITKTNVDTSKEQINSGSLCLQNFGSNQMNSQFVILQISKDTKTAAQLKELEKQEEEFKKKEEELRKKEKVSLDQEFVFVFG